MRIHIIFTCKYISYFTIVLLSVDKPIISNHHSNLKEVITYCKYGKGNVWEFKSHLLLSVNGHLIKLPFISGPNSSISDYHW